MARQAAARLIEAVVTMWLMTIVIFCLVRVTGSPVDVILPDTATNDQREQATKLLGLDRPLVVQYALYLATLVKGDFGRSYTLNVDIGPLVLSHFLNTFRLATVSGWSGPTVCSRIDSAR